MFQLNACPVCCNIPELGYVCGEFFVFGDNDDCPCCGLSFTEMHSSSQQQIDAWNKRISIFKENLYD